MKRVCVWRRKCWTVRSWMYVIISNHRSVMIIESTGQIHRTVWGSLSAFECVSTPWKTLQCRKIRAQLSPYFVFRIQLLVYGISYGLRYELTRTNTFRLPNREPMHQLLTLIMQYTFYSYDPKIGVGGRGGLTVIFW